MVLHSPNALIATKLFAPPVRVERVQRQRLLARLDETLRPGKLLALISAPAGFGKTSLLAEWLAHTGSITAWVSFDSGDNEPLQFLSYLTTALQQARPGLIPDSLALLRASPPAPPQSIIAALVNELSALDPAHPLLLALDDLHFVTSSEVREILTFLIERLPPGLRLAIATRTDPPLPLARMRARGQMVELRAADLRFTPQEAAELLSQITSLPSGPQTLQEIAAPLATRTEGWAAGLQMAGVAMQSLVGQDSPSDSLARLADFVRTFSGSHRYVLDYLAEEVLERLPAATVDFLLQTAILDRFCAELCQVVVDTQTESIDHSRFTDHCRNLLVQLEAANLFIIPLDSERRWYRYHRLFADLLRARLKQANPQQVSVLHKRASAWFEQQGFVAEAISHALAAEDFERAAKLVEQHSIALLSRGELHALLHWINLLPPAIAARRPWLCICRAWAIYFGGELSAVEEPLRQAETQLDTLDEAQRRAVTGHIAAIRTVILTVLPDSGELTELAALAKSYLPVNEWAYRVVEWAIGFYLRSLSDLEGAAEIFERLVKLELAASNPWGLAMNATDLGTVLRLQGKLQSAQAAMKTALDAADAIGARRNGYIGRLLTGLAATYYEQNRLDEARRALDEAIELNQHWRNPNHLVFAFLNLAKVQAAQRDYQGAAASLDAVDAVVRDLPVIPIFQKAAFSARLTFALAQGIVPPPNGPLEEQIQAVLQEAQTGDLPFSESTDARNILFSKILIAQGRCDLALPLLAAIEVTARRLHRGLAQVEILTLKAFAHYRLGQTTEALAFLSQTIALAASDHAMRPILDSALLVPGALAKLLPMLPSTLDPAFRARLLAHLLAALPTAPQTPTAVPPSHPAPHLQPAQNNLVEPLSKREIEVLRLLAAGLTNAQISERLVISAGTVKAHTANIFRKLDASNRTQAVSRAREIGIL